METEIDIMMDLMGQITITTTMADMTTTITTTMSTSIMAMKKVAMNMEEVEVVDTMVGAGVAAVTIKNSS